MMGPERAGESAEGLRHQSGDRITRRLHRARRRRRRRAGPPRGTGRRCSRPGAGGCTASWTVRRGAPGHHAAGAVRAEPAGRAAGGRPVRRRRVAGLDGARPSTAPRARRSAAWRAGRTSGRASRWRPALDNLASGQLEPPASGHDNPHHFDDAAAVRAVAFGATRARTRARTPRSPTPGTACSARPWPSRRPWPRRWRTGSTAAAVGAALAVLPRGHRHRARREAGARRWPVRRATRSPRCPALDAALLDHVYSYGVARRADGARGARAGRGGAGRAERGRAGRRLPAPRSPTPRPR